MNQPVYLYELDSVCNSKNEIKLALDSMYKTIVVDGNVLVLTFNQFADSMLFASIIGNDKMREAFVELICQERIVVSCFASGGEIISSPVRYIVRHLKSFPSKKEDFVFSAVDYLNITSYGIKKRLFEIMVKSLEDNDIDYLNFALYESNMIKKEKDIIFIKNYVEFLLQISLCGIRKLPVKNNIETLKDIIEKTSKCIDLSESVKSVFSNLDTIIVNNKKIKNPKVNNRSFWYKLFKDANDLKKDQAELFIDVCYNIAIESSISNVESIVDIKNEEDYIVDKYNSLKKRYGDNSHRYFYKNTDIEKYIFTNEEEERWQSAARIVSQITKIKDKPNKWYWKRYYNVIDRGEFTWTRKVCLSSILIFGVQVLKFIGIFLINGIFSTMEDCIDRATKNFIISLIFLICSDFVTHRLDIPNLFDILFNRETRNDITTYYTIFSRSNES